MTRTLLLLACILGGCTVTQTGNPSNDPSDAGPDATPDAGVVAGFDLANTEVLPSQLTDPDTPVHFEFPTNAMAGTLRVVAMASDADALELSVVPEGEETAQLPGFTGDWFRIQLLTLAGEAAPQDTLIGSDTLVARTPSCLQVETFVRHSSGDSATLRNTCAEALSISVRTRGEASASTAEPSEFDLSSGAEQALRFTTTVTFESYEEFIIESSTGPPEQATAVTVRFN